MQSPSHLHRAGPCAQDTCAHVRAGCTSGLQNNHTRYTTAAVLTAAARSRRTPASARRGNARGAQVKSVAQTWSLAHRSRIQLSSAWLESQIRLTQLSYCTYIHQRSSTPSPLPTPAQRDFSAEGNATRPVVVASFDRKLCLYRSSSVHWSLTRLLFDEAACSVRRLRGPLRQHRHPRPAQIVVAGRRRDPLASSRDAAHPQAHQQRRRRCRTRKRDADVVGDGKHGERYGPAPHCERVRQTARTAADAVAGIDRRPSLAGSTASIRHCSTSGRGPIAGTDRTPSGESGR